MSVPPRPTVAGRRGRPGADQPLPDEAVALSALGAKSGRGLLGDYTAEAIEAVAARRERVAPTRVAR